MKRVFSSWLVLVSASVFLFTSCDIDGLTGKSGNKNNINSGSRDGDANNTNPDGQGGNRINKPRLTINDFLGKYEGEFLLKLTPSMYLTGQEFPWHTVKFLFEIKLNNDKKNPLNPSLTEPDNKPYITNVRVQDDKLRTVTYYSVTNYPLMVEGVLSISSEDRTLTFSWPGEATFKAYGGMPAEGILSYYTTFNLLRNVTASIDADDNSSYLGWKDPGEKRMYMKIKKTHSSKS